MPTGYTSELYDGKDQTFEEFVLSCARAFCYWMRDSDAKTLTDPRESVPEYYYEWRDRDLAELERLERMSAEEIIFEHEEAYAKVREENMERIDEAIELKKRYTKMLDEVKAWEPPSDIHEGLKDFMIQQLESSIKNDCKPYTSNMTPLPFEWHRERIAAAKRSVEYNNEIIVQEEEKIENNKLWVSQLRESLNL